MVLNEYYIKDIIIIILMIFRNYKGELVEINIYSFKNDKIFYKKIMELKTPFTKLNKNNSKNIHSNDVIYDLIK
jgi:hypothetical protein